MNTETGTNDGQSASRRNYEELTRAREDIHEALAQEPGHDKEAWLRRVLAAVRSFSETLKQHQHLSEEEGGTFTEAAGEKPALLSAIRGLEREHADMLFRAGKIEQEVEREFAFQEFKVDLVRLEVTALHDILHLHLVQADWLAYDAYFRVEGGEGA